ncbi:MAG TPA: response regulator [Candidatus Methylomirabilis sp.]|nr:response regulator [Candidatus Methylomirabilis sp.]
MAKKILIVDDEPDVLATLRDYFKGQNYEVETGVNGEEGVDKADKFKPDIILLDVLMPVMDGITALKKLKDNPATAKMEVIMLTNIGDQDKVAAAMESGTTNYFIKSDYSLDDLKKKIEELVP